MLPPPTQIGVVRDMWPILKLKATEKTTLVADVALVDKVKST